MTALRPPSAAAVASAVELAPIASLAMYDWPELQAANDALWAAVAQRLERAGVPAPSALSRTADLEALWRSPALLLGQTCGYPLMKRLSDRVRLVATPRYAAPGCEGPFRRSAIVVRADSPADQLVQLRGARCALNDPMSDSGMNLLRAAVAPLAAGPAFFSEVLVTGAHLASAEAVASQAADVAAIDAVTYAHLRRFKPDLAARLRVLAWTARSPGLPLITSAATPRETLRALQEALLGAAADPRLAEVREALRLDGFSLLPLNYYRLTLHHEERAGALGYPHLR